MTFTIHNRAQDPAIFTKVDHAAFDLSWPEFMAHDPTAELYYSYLDDVADYVLLATDGDQPVAKGYSVPFAFGIPGRQELPDAGWDEVIRWAHSDRLAGRERNAVAALEIVILREHQGRGLAPVMVEALRENAFRLGHDVLYVPVRPSQKSAEPQTPMSEYAYRTREDGLPDDAWLRVHVRAGGRIVKVCPTAMTIPGTLQEWRSWTGLPFDTDDPVIVDGALSPVLVSQAQESAVYVEPNVWVEHRRP
ncbi:MAG TPA: N-acetyltransferase [Candidatus Ruania gallistercoris]|uniref:N-acetyltransferase n=1 Tax=Candidatus Ruania gallistercoris TaxID=2838746 RepID=A0A9D2EEQ0_9MICO|nr:N-acetyltransferase [Candidatus Ruania gallistercoris]